MKIFECIGDVKECRSEMENFVLNELDLVSPLRSQFLMVAEHLASSFLERGKRYVVTLAIDRENLSLNFTAKETS